MEILDASAIICGYKPKKKAFTIPEVTSEIKDIRSKQFLNSLLKKRILEIKDVDEKTIKDTKKILRKIADISKLSFTDIKLISLAISIHKKGENVVVVTDDYMVQNALKILKIPFISLLSQGIKQVYRWVKICTGCKKIYPEEYKGKDCEICGSPIVKKRISKN
ncbi:conserved hypothetical protein [Methanothermus fervidus DSM 2088]|uniref:Ribonuclease PIN domain-containing protein n=1 Tax=Methanothermus fervidus (strain ATCC 43054 / DSM 2088 / JCM 10308 / V24 S) TaxID=523846 RepID=E3GWB6_METFV|nr:hypothetical protein [Methanothermus fervidus]ADP77881.1 conserved hypothetical protein [Methanothermus fervidus DSM 2088]